MKFLDTFDAFGCDVLIPIDRIQFINFTCLDGKYSIRIVSDDDEWEEFFKTQKLAYLRYSVIKDIINGE